MKYPVHTIATPQELERCPEFHLDHFQWTCWRCPATWGRMGYLAGAGLLVRMTALEQAPKRTFVNNREMVCKDSAMEVFFAFPHPPSGPPTDSDLYFNLEVNANGALYAKHGRGRRGRNFFTPEEERLMAVRTQIYPDRWSMELCLPLSVLERLAGISELRPGNSFYCNFYKISEDPQIEHYATYSPIDSKTPNFHLPHCFARAVMVEK